MTSEACCTLPPVIAEGYKEKGSYIEVEGYKTYATGPDSATSGILVIYDIFGFFPQTIQGSDILSSADQKHPRKVFMPDFFKGKPVSLADYPPTTDEQKKRIGDFFAGPAEAKGMVGAVLSITKALQAANPSIKKWGIVGYCWGAKITSLVSGSDTIFTAAAQCHPAAVSADDAAKVTIPMAMLASKDEPAADVEAFEKALTTPKHVDTYKTSVHGWMAARADLSGGETKAEYERGYQALLTFFDKHL